MRSMLAFALLVFAEISSAQTTQTQCRSGYDNRTMNCTSTTTQPYEPRIEAPNVLDSYQKGRELAIREQELQLQRDQLRQRNQAPIATPQTSNADIETLKAMVKEKEEREKSARSEYWLQQMNACIRVNKEEKAVAECRDRLLLSDPYFARAHSELNRPSPSTQKTQ